MSEFKKPQPNKGGYKKPYDKNQNRKPYNKNNTKQPVKKKAAFIKKQASLKHIPMSELPEKRMYRLSIIFGSSVVCDTFVVEEQISTAVVKTRDKILNSYQDLLKLLGNDIVSGMLPRPYTKEMENSHKGILEGNNMDIIHKMVRALFTPGENDKDVEFPTVVSFTIQPGMPVKGVTKRISVRLNYIKNPNFSPKKAAKKEPEIKKPTPRKIVIVKKNNSNKK